MKVLAIIPARGGSKRLPRKNMLNLCGKPLIQWSIEKAQDCNEIDTVMVSTDCSEIASFASSIGAKVPYLRHKTLSNDTASSIDVVLDVIKYYESIDEIFDIVILLQPTSPLRTSEDIRDAIKLYYKKGANAVVSITECEHSPLWCGMISDDLNMDLFISKKIHNMQSQDLPIYYRLNGAIYLIDKNVLMKEKTFFPNKSYSLIMPPERSVDIDNRVDFIVAESILKDKI